ncbi:hypothetical protein NM688_g582 [Phlebia brevispora]|uniref:Uncharacterized protein n=1 Tax=Phlebia brevispora TaxID=194682 RepID=A0ACC1TE89_9APHY|nr:hypothetical protein NM688_g582 [Phlebia brevispora]
MRIPEYDPREDRLHVIQTSEQTAHIEVPRSWRLWSGWCPRWWESYIQTWRERQDPMDDKDFEEITAFPALKPDETIFHVGLPDRTRNQLGWYHVKPWPPRSLPTVGDGHERSATGGDVPVELFDIVLKCMTCNEMVSSSDIFMSKRELGLISLVCQRWARILQPLIFDTITLRSGEDAHTFLSFHDHPRSPIVRYIHTVVLSQSLTRYPYPPWVHRAFVFTEIMGVWKSRGILKVTLRGPTPPEKFTKGVCEMLPKSVPWSFTSVTYLNLEDLHFKKLDDFMRIPRELPLIQWLQCSNVTWKDTSSEELPPTVHYRDLGRQTDTGVKYALRRCTDDRAAIWFAALLAPRWRNRLERSDAHQICRIASAFTQDIGERVIWTGRHEHHLWFDTSCPVTVYFTVQMARQARRVQAITLDVSYFTEERLKCSDWAAIDRLTIALSSLETLLIYSNSRDNLLLFYKKVVVQKMPNFHGLSKLKYALLSRRGGESTYTFVACSEDKVRTIGTIIDPLDTNLMTTQQAWEVCAGNFEAGAGCVSAAAIQRIAVAIGKTGDTLEGRFRGEQ